MGHNSQNATLSARTFKLRSQLGRLGRSGSIGSGSHWWQVKPGCRYGEELVQERIFPLRRLGRSGSTEDKKFWKPLVAGAKAEKPLVSSALQESELSGSVGVPGKGMGVGRLKDNHK